jgi:hypothetical protein
MSETEPTQLENPSSEGSPAEPQADQPSGDPDTNGKTFTRAEVGRMIATEIKKKYGDYDQLKANSEQLKQLEAANQSDLEKMQTRAATEERKRQELEAELARLRVQRAIDKRSAEKSIPATAASKMIDIAEVEFDEDGEPVNIEELIDALIEAESWLVQQQTPVMTSADQGTRRTSTDDPSKWSVDTFREKLRK